jgi:hypothetical protein
MTRSAARGVLGCTAPSLSGTGARWTSAAVSFGPPDWAAAAAFRSDDRRRLERNRLPLPWRALIAVRRGGDRHSSLPQVCRLQQRPARLRRRLPAHLLGLEMVGRVACRAAPALRPMSLGPPASAEAATAPRAGRRRGGVGRARGVLKAGCARSAHSPLHVARSRTQKPRSTALGRHAVRRTARRRSSAAVDGFLADRRAAKRLTVAACGLRRSERPPHWRA